MFGIVVPSGERQATQSHEAGLKTPGGLGRGLLVEGKGMSPGAQGRQLVNHPSLNGAWLCLSDSEGGKKPLFPLPPLLPPSCPLLGLLFPDITSSL